MALSIGVLIIGSLYWDTDPQRQQWRDARLCVNQSIDVRAPIRYGRISGERGHTYTMVLSRQCTSGKAKAVRYQSDVSNPADLDVQAEYLWAAERKRRLNGRISADWGCVTLLPNPDRNIPAQIVDAWAARVRTEQHYGNIEQAEGEGILVNDRGILQIPWPAMITDNRPLAIDLLLVTANQPSLTGEPRSYPTPEMIADAWRNDTHENVRYFWNNVRDGICTFEDDAIRRRLENTHE